MYFSVAPRQRKVPFPIMHHLRHNYKAQSSDTRNPTSLQSDFKKEIKMKYYVYYLILYIFKF